MQPICTIKLVNGGETIIEKRDYKKVSKYRWFKSSLGYAHRQGWTGIKPNRKHWTIWLHRVINKTPPHLFTDHINGQKLDNRRSNLRTVTKAHNSTNRPKIRALKLSSQLKGVSFHPSTRLWRARIRDGDYERTTYHKTEQQAALDYNLMALDRFGSYAQINKLPEGIEPTVRRKKTSKYIGVSETKYGRWTASIEIKGKCTHISVFETEREAALAYNTVAFQLRGDKAKLNVVK